MEIILLDDDLCSILLTYYRVCAYLKIWQNEIEIKLRHSKHFRVFFSEELLKPRIRKSLEMYSTLHGTRHRSTLI